MSAAPHAVDLAAVSFRRAPGTAVTNGERLMKDVVVLGREWAVVVKAQCSGCGVNSLGDESGDIDDPLTLVDASLDVITHSHWRRRSGRRAVDAHVPATAGRGCTRSGLGDPHGL